MIIDNIKYETELLEALDWDTSKLSQLLKYLEKELNSDVLIRPDTLLESISLSFSHDVMLVVKRIFADIVVRNNLHVSKNKDFN